MVPIPTDPLQLRCWNDITSNLTTIYKKQFDSSLSTNVNLGNGQTITHRVLTIGRFYDSSPYLPLDPSHDWDRDLEQRTVTLKYTFEVKGTVPSTGYPLFIALHGGGGKDGQNYTYSNDKAWLDMSKGWKLYINAGIYIAVRGGGESWDMHFTSQGYNLIEKLIESMMLTQNVDPNQVYLMGFSAGGDGVYRLGARLADRWAAVMMDAGHSGDVRLENFRNTPICLQVGEFDTGSSRNIDVGQKNNQLIEHDTTYGKMVPHDCFMHQGGDHNSWSGDSFWGKWDKTSQTYTAVVETLPIIDNVPEWLKQYKPEAGTCSYTTVKQQDTNEIKWLTQYVRKLPTHVVYARWGSDNDNDNFNQYTETGLSSPRRHWWLDLGPQPLSLPDNGVIEVSIDKTNTITVKSAKGRLGILLREGMVLFDEVVHLQVCGQTLPPVDFTKTPPSEKVIRLSMARCDPTMIFTHRIDLVQDGTTWKVASSE